MRKVIVLRLNQPFVKHMTSEHQLPIMTAATSHSLLLQECFRAIGPKESVPRHDHCFELVVEQNVGEFVARLTYVSGTLGLTPGATVAEFKAAYELFHNGGGQLEIGHGWLEVKIPEMRGIGIGGFLMGFLIWLVKQRLPPLEVSPILLSVDDARSDAARDRRNGFWEKLGFVFDYGDTDRRWGVSRPMRSDALRDQPNEFAAGWSVLECSECEGEGLDAAGS